MRPIQSLFLLLVLLACGVAAFFVFRGGENGPQGIARSVDIRDLNEEDGALQPARTPSELVAPEGDNDLAAGEGRADLTDPEVQSTSAQSELAAERIMTGRIEDSVGRPIPGAEIFVSRSFGSMGFMPIDLAAPGDEDSRWIKRKSTVTDEEGSFRIESPKGASGHIAVRASGFAPLDDKVALRSTDSTDLGTLTLEDGVILAGRVVDATGSAVEGVVLRGQSTDGASGGITIFSGEGGRYLTETDRSGNFRVDKLSAGPFRIRFHHDEYPSETIEGTAPRPGLYRSDYLVELRSSLAIEGLVTGLPTELPELIKVSATPKIDVDAPEEKKAGASRRSGSLQKDGRFRIAGLVEGVEYNVSLREGSGVWHGERLSGTVPALAGANDVVLEWRVDAAVEMRAVDATTGEPIESYEMAAGIDWTETLVGEDGRPLKNHPGGRARYSGLHPRENSNDLRVKVEAVGYETWERRGMKLAEGQQLNLGDIALTPVPLLVVTVLDAKTGNPIRRSRVTMTELDPRALTGSGSSAGRAGGVAIQATSASISLDGSDLTDSELFPEFSTKSEDGRTDDEGVVRFSTRPGKSVRVRARHSAYAETSSEPIVFAESGGADVEWTARLTRGGEVLLHAKDAKGEPLVGRSIEHRPPSALEGDSAAVDHSQRQTDEEGIVRYEHLVPGKHEFRIGKGNAVGAFMVGGGADSFVSFSSFGSASSGDEAADDESDRPWSEVEVVEGMKSTVEVVGPAQISTHGIVTEEGSPLAGATLRLSLKEDDNEMFDPFAAMGGPSGRTSSDGSWTIDGLEPGEYELRITHHTRHQPAVFDVILVEGENDLGTTNLAVSILEGRVTSGGDPVVGAEVTASIADGKGISTRRMVTSFSINGKDGDHLIGGGGEGTVVTDEDGAYRLRGVEPDRNLFINVEAQGFQPLRSDVVRLSPGELHTGFDLELLAGGRLEIEVVKPDGTPLAQALITARYTGEEKGIGTEHEIADSKGKVVLKGLAPGAWIVEARNLNLNGDSSGGTERPEKTIEILRGETATARFEVPD